MANELVIAEGKVLAQKTSINTVVACLEDWYILRYKDVYYSWQVLHCTAEGLINDPIEIDEAIAIDEVVVTALGIQRQKRELGYSTVSIKSDELTQGKSLSVAIYLIFYPDFLFSHLI